MAEQLTDKQLALIEIITSHGYKKEEYGYKKVSVNYTHWITLFGEGEMQMYAYCTDDEDLEKVYDTGILDVVMRSELTVLINVFHYNHD